MKKYLIKTYLIVLIIAGFISGDAKGQVMKFPSYVPDPTVYSPQTAQMVRFDEVPVNMSTGRIDLSIPLVDIPDKNFEFPIMLSYNSDGFKPTEPDNYVGRNWTLLYGGVISRQVRGVPDDITRHYTFVRTLEEGGREYFFDGFMKMLGTGKFNMNEMRTNITKDPYKYARISDDYAPLPTITGTNIEASPDIYYFNFGKHSGKFMINYDGSVSVTGYNGHTYEIDLSEYKMTNSTNEYSTVIKIKTDDGYIYSFGGTGYAAVEYSVASWEKDQPPTGYDAYRRHTINAWHLSQIKAPNGRRLFIQYKDIDKEYHRDLAKLLGIGYLPESQKQEIVPLYSLSGHACYMTEKALGGITEAYLRDVPAKEANTYLYNLNKIALVDKISTDSWEIKFHYSKKEKYTELENLKAGFSVFAGGKLDSLEVRREGNVREICSFEYNYKCDNRLFLTGLKHSKQGSYHFQYNWISESVLPTTSNIDHWGYWRGRSNNNKRIYPGNCYVDNYLSMDYTLTSDDRNTTGENCEATLLSQVIYPTGGKTEFKYEPHRYSFIDVQNATTDYYPSWAVAPDDETIAGGARIKAIRFYNTDPNLPVKETRYTYSDDTGKQGILTYIPLYRYIGLYVIDTSTLWGSIIENSDGIGRSFYPSQHIWYPVVNEYYIDPKLGTDELNSSHKQSIFFIDPNIPDYTDFVYGTYVNSSYAPNRATMGQYVRESFFKNRFRWPGRSQSYKNGKIMQERYFDSQNKQVRWVNYQYKDIFRDDYSLCIYLESLQLGTFYGIYTHAGREYFGMSLLSQKVVTEYDGSNCTTNKKEMYEYDDSGYLKKQTILLSGGDSLVTTYKYLEEMPALITDRNQIIYGFDKTKVVQLEHYDYRMINNWYMDTWPAISDYYTGTDSLKLEKRASYLRYDYLGNPIQMERDGLSWICIWANDGQNLVARIENVTYEQVTEALGEIPEVVSAAPDYNYYTVEIEGLRKKLPHAHVFNYTYDPAVGITSSTDPSGRVMYYEYDLAGRLVKTSRTNETGGREILQLNRYHLVNE